VADAPFETLRSYLTSHTLQSVPEEPSVRNERTASRRAAVCSGNWWRTPFVTRSFVPHERSSGNVYGEARRSGIPLHPVAEELSVRYERTPPTGP